MEKGMKKLIIPFAMTLIIALGSCNPKNKQGNDHMNESARNNTREKNPAQNAEGMDSTATGSKKMDTTQGQNM